MIFWNRRRSIDAMPAPRNGTTTPDVFAGPRGSSPNPRPATDEEVVG